jgi:hypothetical protein
MSIKPIELKASLYRMRPYHRLNEQSTRCAIYGRAMLGTLQRIRSVMLPRPPTAKLTCADATCSGQALDTNRPIAGACSARLQRPESNAR